MFDEHQQKPAPINVTPAFIMLASGATGVLLSLGLCKLQGALGNDTLVSLGTLGFLLFGLSVLAIVVSIPCIIVILILNAIRG